VTPPKKRAGPDLIALDAGLRRTMTELDAGAYLLRAELGTALGPEVEALRQAAREKAQEAADTILAFLELLEKSPQYRAAQGRNNGRAL
jgi:hypothetical protein